MTIEQYNELKEYENLLYTASQRNYAMFGSMGKKKRLSELYTEILGKKSNMLGGCGGCALNEMKEIANAYYSYVPPTVEEPKEESKVMIIEEPKVKITKTKKTQKKK